MDLHKSVYTKTWFGSTQKSAQKVPFNLQGPLGAGGLMAKLTKFVLSLTSYLNPTHLLSQRKRRRTRSIIASYLTTCITCLIFAFSRSCALTLVILSTISLLTFVQAISQSLASRLLAAERSATAILADHALASIDTVKACNAVPYEQRSLDDVLRRLN